MLRIVLDPNVLISALISPDGVPARLVGAWRAAAFTLVASEKLLFELERALGYPKLEGRIKPDEGAALVAGIRDHAELAEDPATLGEAAIRDPGDAYLLELGRAGRADFLVSGDADLARVEQPPLPVLTPRQFLELLSARAGERDTR